MPVTRVELDMEQTALGIDFNMALADLESLLQQLQQAVASERLPAQVVGRGSERPREMAAQIYSAIEYRDGQEVNEVVTVVGAIAASEATLALARRVNEKKDRLVAAKQAMDKHEVPHPTKPNATMSLYAYHIRHNLKRPRLHFVQLRRRILVLDEYPYPPRRVGLVMASNDRKIQTISWQSAVDRLARKGDNPGIETERRQLDGLPRDELLAHVVESTPHVRANLAWVHPTGGVSRLQRRLSMPLLYPYSEGDPVPLLSGPRLGPSERVERLDVQVEATAICPSIRVHRYRAECRDAKKRGV